MCFKSDTMYHLKSFFAMVKTQYHSKIQHIFSGDGDEYFPEIQQVRSDNGAEFLSNEMQHFFHKTGLFISAVAFLHPNKTVL